MHHHLLPMRQIADGVFVAPQLEPAAMAVAARVGFKSVVNNRPDFEHDPGQPTNASIEAAAKESGLDYHFLPVDGAHQTPEQIAAFARLLPDLPRPLLLFCRSGARSTRLFAAASQL